MHKRLFETASLLAVTAIGLGFSNVATADVVNVDEFAVVNNATQIFDDSFNRTLNLVGGPGTTLSSGANFANGRPASYHVKGTITESTANNGQAKLDTADGTLVFLPDPFIPKTLNVQAFLQTGTNLNPTHTFSTVGLFDLAVPTQVLGTYFVGLTNSTVGSPGRELEMRVRECASGKGGCGGLTGPVLQFIWLDFADNMSQVVKDVAITPTELADPQLELALSLGAAGSNVITASYAFGSGNTLGSFTGSLTMLGSTDSTTDLFTASKDFALAGFGNFAPAAIPEPSTWAMTLIGFAGLGFLVQRTRKRATAAA
jgi:hypothetical protein